MNIQKITYRNFVTLLIILILLIELENPSDSIALEKSCQRVMAFSGLVSYAPENRVGVYLTNLDKNSDILKITDDNMSYKLLSWSPDGLQLGLINTIDILGEGGGIPVIYDTITNQISNLDLGTKNLEVLSFNWSPDGKRILLLAKDNDTDSSEFSLFLMETNKPETLENLIPNWSESILGVRWSGDSNEIAFESRDVQNQDTEIFLLSIEEQNNHPTQLTNNDWNDRLGSWSHDGSQISFFSDEYGNFDIYTLQFSTNTITRLTNNNLLESSPIWSYDDQYIAFRRDSNNLIILNTHSLIEQEIGRINTNLSYETVGFSWLPNENILSIREAEYGVNDSEIYTYNLESGEIRNITEGFSIKIIMAHNWSPCIEEPES